MTDFAAIRSAHSVQAAYARGTQNSKGPNDAATVDVAQAPTADFSTLVTNAAAKAVDTVRTGDQMALAGLQGQAGLQQVVEATMAMESTVQVSVALRDKLVEAYQEVMRMPI